MKREKARVAGGIALIVAVFGGVSHADIVATVVVAVTDAFLPVLGLLAEGAFSQIPSADPVAAIVYVSGPLADVVIQYQLQNVVYALAIGAGVGLAFEKLEEAMTSSK